MPDTAVAEKAKPLHPVVVFHNYLNDRSDALRAALPPHIKLDRFISSVMTAVQLNPDLLACDMRSLWLACVRCAQDGLLPDGTEAAIVAYKDKAQYLCMYQGLLKKFRNSGNFQWITTGIAYTGENYEHWIDESGEHFKHVPSNDDPKAKIHRVYALATTKDGGTFIAELTPADVAKRRNMSRASRDDAPWKMWEGEMMKKTALRVLSKLLPKSSDLDAFLQRDEDESLGVHTIDTVSEQRAGNVLEQFAAESASPPPPQTTPAEANEAAGPRGTASAKP